MELERKYANKLADTRQASLRLSETAAARERLLSERLLDAQRVALQSARASGERLQRLSEMLDASRAEVLRHSQALAARESEFREEVLRLSQALKTRERELGAALQTAEKEAAAQERRADEATRERDAMSARGREISLEHSCRLADRDREIALLRKQVSRSTRALGEADRMVRDAINRLIAGAGDPDAGTPGAPPAGIEGLLALTGRQFVEQAYRVILHRDPDPPGFTHYGEELRRGVSRAEIVRRLRYSPEGRRIAADVRSIRGSLALARLCRVPLVGRCIESVAALLAYPRQRNVFEHRTAEELERVRAAVRETERNLLALQELLGRERIDRPVNQA